MCRASETRSHLGRALWISAVLTSLASCNGRDKGGATPTVQLDQTSQAVTTTPLWAAGHSYARGDLVTFARIRYECRQAHIPQVGQEPLPEIVVRANFLVAVRPGVGRHVVVEEPDQPTGLVVA